MTSKNLGRVQPTPQGDWAARAAANQYRMLDIVKHAGESWVLSSLTATNEVPGVFSGWVVLTDSETIRSELKEELSGFMGSAEKELRYLHPYEIDLMGDEFDKDTYYPVILPLSARESNKFEIFKFYAEGNRSDSGLLGCNTIVNASGGAWGGNPMRFGINSFQTYQKAVAAIGFMDHGIKLGFYMKGGHKYRLRSTNPDSQPIVITEHTSNYNQRNTGLDCGPVDAVTADSSDGAVDMSVSNQESSAYINSLGG